jgi:hypothetical protein
MSPTAAYFSLIQYCPDPARAEAVNVGVTLFAPALGCIARVANSSDRIRAVFGRRAIDADRIKSDKYAIAQRLESEGSLLPDLASFAQFVGSFANELRVTPPRPIRLAGRPDELLERLFVRLVSEPRPAREAPALLPEMEQLLRKPLMADRIDVNVKVLVPDMGKQLDVPYAYQNGVYNLIKPHRFSADPGRAVHMAVTLAAEGNLIYQEERPTQRQLVVVPILRASASDPGLEVRLGRIFWKHHVKMIPRANVDQLVEEIERTAHTVH